LNAVVAALAIQSRIGDYNRLRVEQERFQVRVGLNTGPVIRKDNDIFGEVVNVASRMQSAASPGDILLTEGTYSEVRDYVRCIELGKIQAKGIKEAITAYSPEEITVDLKKIQSEGEAAGDASKGRDASMEKLKETMFVPSFEVPADKGQAGSVAELVREAFSEIAQAVEDVASDYHEEYAFKKYLQERWNQLVGRL